MGISFRKSSLRDLSSAVDRAMLEYFSSMRTACQLLFDFVKLTCNMASDHENMDDHPNRSQSEASDAETHSKVIGEIQQKDSSPLDEKDRLPHIEKRGVRSSKDRGRSPEKEARNHLSTKKKKRRKSPSPSSSNSSFSSESLSPPRWRKKILQEEEKTISLFIQ